MWVALPVHQDRISPVLDMARHLLLVEVKEGRELRRSEVQLGEGEPLLRARAILALGPELLICGAVSRSFEAVLVASGVQVLSNTCGPVEEVIGAFASGRLTDEVFLMPGCARHRSRRRRRGGGAGGGGRRLTGGLERR
jgi:predicted Fe-Mo cluster-binding NifX family protein